jgi:hypothetical protein
MDTNSMLNNTMKDFLESLPNIRDKFSILPNGNILDNTNGDIILIQNLEKIINKDMSKLLEEKLKIKHIIKEENIRGYRSGADKILEDEQKSYGYRLIITIDNIPFHESTYCTDDYKYDIGPEKLLKNIEIIRNSYFKIIMNAFLTILNKKNKYTDKKETIYIPDRPNVVVYGGEKK